MRPSCVMWGACCGVAGVAGAGAGLQFCWVQADSMQPDEKQALPWQALPWQALPRQPLE